MEWRMIAVGAVLMWCVATLTQTTFPLRPSNASCHFTLLLLSAFVYETQDEVRVQVLQVPPERPNNLPSPFGAGTVTPRWHEGREIATRVTLRRSKLEG